MTTQVFPLPEIQDDDVLTQAASIRSSLAWLEAEQYDYLAQWLEGAAAEARVAGLAGRERLIAYGGAGSPAVLEFAVTGIAVEMGLSLWAAQKLVAGVLSLKYRLPQIFAVLHAGDVDAWRCRMAEATIADMLAARDITIRPGGPGVVDIGGSVSTADGTRLEARLVQLIGWMVELGDTRTKAVLRSVALGMIAEPGLCERLHARVCAHRTGQPALDNPDEMVVPLPATTLCVHLDHGTDTWSLDGAGPMSRAEATDLVGHSHVTLKPVIDLSTDLTYTGYVAPPRHQLPSRPHLEPHREHPLPLTSPRQDLRRLDGPTTRWHLDS